LLVIAGLFVITGVTTDPNTAGEPPREVPIIEAALLVLAACGVYFERLRALVGLPR
jgi:hypothetical protein